MDDDVKHLLLAVSILGLWFNQLWAARDTAKLIEAVKRAIAGDESEDTST